MNNKWMNNKWIDKRKKEKEKINTNVVGQKRGSMKRSEAFK